MKLTDRERKAIALALKELREKNEFNDELQEQLRRESVRRRKVATRFRKQLLKTAFKAVGIDQEEIVERQKSANQAQLKRIAKLRPQVEANAKNIARRHAVEIRFIKKRAERWHRIPPPEPILLPELVILDRAAYISLSSLNKAVGNATNDTPFYNTIQTEIKGSGGYAGDFYRSLHAVVTFVYTPSRSGVVHAWAWVTTNGSLSWTTDSSCFSTPTITSEMSSSMSLSQGNPVGAITLPSQQVSYIDKTIGYDHHCSGDSGFSIIDNSMSFETSAPYLNVVAGLPIIINVSIDLSVYVALGTVDLNLATNGQQINVPAVILNLD